MTVVSFVLFPSLFFSIITTLRNAERYIVVVATRAFHTAGITQRSKSRNEKRKEKDRWKEQRKQV